MRRVMQIVTIAAAAIAAGSGLGHERVAGGQPADAPPAATQTDNRDAAQPFRSRRPVRPSSVSRDPVLPPEPGPADRRIPPITEVAPPDDWTPEERRNIEVYEKSNRSVVNITTRTVRPENLFYVEVAEGSGSGSVLDQEGHILTNLHVIEGRARPA